MKLNSIERTELQLEAAGRVLEARPAISGMLQDLFTVEVDAEGALVSAWMATRDPETHQDALNIVADLLACSSDHGRGTLDACSAILAQLGLFPAIDVLQRNYPEWTPSLPVALQLDLIMHGMENRLDNDMEDILTDFQAELLEIAASEDDASITAPTSAGKSFVMARIARKLLQEGSRRIVYVVPTRALIREVSTRIRRDLREHDLPVPVTTAPQPRPQLESIVYVLTQERLLALIHNGEQEEVDLDLVIIDEAHEVGHGDRGIILEDAVQEARALASRPRLLFVAPDISNPEYMVKSPSLDAQDAVVHTEPFSPIAHRFWVVEPDKVRDPEDGRRYNYRLRVTLRDAPEETVGIIPLEGRLPSAKMRKLAEVARLVHSPNSTTILYLDKKNYAEAAARHLADRIPRRDEASKGIRALIEFIDEHVHAKHELTDWLSRGIAIHYRTLPKTVRQRIEELAAAGELDFVACTSTLLHGVNLPCNDIVLYEPRRGTPHLTISEFRNLIGRSGRMDHSLEGNVWLIDPYKWSTDTYLPHPSQPVKSALENELENGAPLINELLDISMLGSDKRQKLAAAALGRTYQLVARDQAVGEFEGNTDARNTLVELQERLEDLRESIEAPEDLLRRHSTFDPRAISMLFSTLVSAPREEFLAWVPSRSVIDNDLFDYLERTLEPLSEHFGPKLSTDPQKAAKQVRYRAYLAYRWLEYPTFKVFLEEHINYEASDQDQRSDPVFVTEQTRKAIGGLEDDVRFTMVQQYRLLLDILQTVVVERSEVPSVEMAPIDLYLDFGTTDDRILAIIGLGFSRETAGYIMRGLRDADLEWEEPEDVIDHLVAMESSVLEAWDMPAESWQEICLVVGRDEGEVVW